MWDLFPLGNEDITEERLSQTEHDECLFDSFEWIVRFLGILTFKTILIGLSSSRACLFFVKTFPQSAYEIGVDCWPKNMLCLQQHLPLAPRLRNGAKHLFIFKPELRH